ncbi:MAG: ZIP family metal transporter [Fuerstiella sp.]
MSDSRSRITVAASLPIIVGLSIGLFAFFNRSAVFAQTPPVSPAETVDLSAFGASKPADATAEPSVVSGGWSNVLLAAYCLLIVGGSLLGGLLPFLLQLTHTRMQTVISFVGGLMLGIGFFHLMPHAVHELHSAGRTAEWMMVGIVMMFALLRLFHFHNHEPVNAFDPAGEGRCDHDEHHGPGHDHDHDHDHDHAAAVSHEPAGIPGLQAVLTGVGHSPAECHTHGHSHGLSWFGIAFGLSLHTLIDGLALAASVNAQASSVPGFRLAGFATFLAVLLHKPLDAVSITSLMVAGGWQKRTMMLVNTAFSLMCPLGAVLFLLGVRQFAGYQHEILGTALAFSAGVFICISLSDLLPEMEFHSHNKVQLTVALGLGIVLSWGLTFLEQGHLH